MLLALDLPPSEALTLSIQEKHASLHQKIIIFKRIVLKILRRFWHFLDRIDSYRVTREQIDLESTIEMRTRNLIMLEKKPWYPGTIKIFKDEPLNPKFIFISLGSEIIQLKFPLFSSYSCLSLNEGHNLEYHSIGFIASCWIWFGCYFHDC